MIKMATAHSTRRHPLLCFCIFLSSMLSLSHGTLTPDFKTRAVNLGGWLVAEKWIKPSLFDGIPNKDFLDGTRLQFKSVMAGKYLCAETGGGSILVANRTVASSWETFKLWRINETSYRLRVFNKLFVGVDTGGNGIDLVAIVADPPGISETFEIVRNSDDPNRVRIKVPNGFFLQLWRINETSYRLRVFNKLFVGVDTGGNGIDLVAIVADPPGVSETFEIVRNSDDPNRIRIKVPNGFFLQVNTDNPVTADSKGDGSWGNDDESVFIITNTGGLHGEFQLTNGYGPVNASQEHWNTFIVEDDFKFISSNGINARSSICRKYGINVIIDLHAAPGSQNGYEHSSSRDGSQEWGLLDQNIQYTVNVIGFLTSRYANNPRVYAVELMNEPLSPGASLDSLNKYYSAGYNVVRKNSSTAYVIMSNRLGAIDPQELFPIASSLEGSVIDIHYYNLFSNSFNNMSVQQNIDFIYNNRLPELYQLTTSNGPLTFIGEWVAEWNVKGATKEDYIKFANAQLNVYGKASQNRWLQQPETERIGSGGGSSTRGHSDDQDSCPLSVYLGFRYLRRKPRPSRDDLGTMTKTRGTSADTSASPCHVLKLFSRDNPLPADVFSSENQVSNADVMGMWRHRVNTPTKLEYFRQEFSIPADVHLKLAGDNDTIMPTDHTMPFPIVAFTECGLRLPLDPLFREVLHLYRLNPMQLTINSYRVINGIIALARQENLRITLADLQYYYTMCPLNLKDRGFVYYLKPRSTEFKIVADLPDSNKEAGDDFLIASGNWEFGPDEDVHLYPLPRTFTEGKGKSPKPTLSCFYLSL
ncbi:hypothetical protein TEA_023073 [Camellia sinensis var. sinensis]|uniref:Uncharacterized protein n=1 Tax=Camellia sinensis var. sinensis TaxID=542762 RepID=A0A4S4E6G7_CAMSN|nr:hypothetical protein TEA_023073 [Camellia sinensis var. sinensis]